MEWDDMHQTLLIMPWKCYEKYDSSKEIAFGYYIKIFLFGALGKKYRDLKRKYIPTTSLQGTAYFSDNELTYEEMLEDTFNIKEERINEKFHLEK